MAREGRDGTDATFPPPMLACDEPSHPSCCLAMVQILGRTPRLAKRRARKRGQDWGLIFACSSIVSGGKKWQHRVQFFSPQSSSGPAREASLTDDFQHLCYAAVADEGLHITTSLSFCLSMGHSLSPPTTHTSKTTARMTDLPWKLPWNGL